MSSSAAERFEWLLRPPPPDSGIDRKALEATSDALLAMKRNLLAMSDGTTLAGNREEEDIGKRSKPRKAKKAA